MQSAALPPFRLAPPLAVVWFFAFQSQMLFAPLPQIVAPVAPFEMELSEPAIAEQLDGTSSPTAIVCDFEYTSGAVTPIELV
jgi:hypothetical protein